MTISGRSCESGYFFECYGHSGNAWGRSTNHHAFLPARARRQRKPDQGLPQPWIDWRAVRWARFVGIQRTLSLARW
jgi:hypothetical protein